MNVKKTALAILLALTASTAIATTASAETRWDHRHPRQDEVFDRLANQRHAIHQERRGGELSGPQARRLLTADHRIAREDRRFSHVNGGYITRGEQWRLNRQENRVHRHID